MGSRIGRSIEHRVANERTFIITLKGYPRNFVWFSVDSKLKGEGGRVVVEPVGREERLCICVLFYEAKGFVFWDGNLTTATCCYYYYYLLCVNPHDYYIWPSEVFPTSCRGDGIGATMQPDLFVRRCWHVAWLSLTVSVENG